MRRAELQGKLSIGVEQFEGGELINAEDVSAELEADIQQIKTQAQQVW